MAAESGCSFLRPFFFAAALFFAPFLWAEIVAAAALFAARPPLHFRSESETVPKTERNSNGDDDGEERSDVEVPNNFLGEGGGMESEVKPKVHRHPMAQPLARHNDPPQHPVEEVTADPQHIVIDEERAAVLHLFHEAPPQNDARPVAVQHAERRIAHLRPHRNGAFRPNVELNV